MGWVVDCFLLAWVLGLIVVGYLVDTFRLVGCAAYCGDLLLLGCAVSLLLVLFVLGFIGLYFY